MNNEKDLKHCVGFIRISEPILSEHGEAIKRRLAEVAEILDEKQALENGQYMAGRDIVMRHPDFDQIDPAAALPRYECDFFEDEDPNSVTLGPIYRYGLSS